jgi:L-alanine-DL-glutamate epimerase-like enolase superfamily enzyme
MHRRVVAGGRVTDRVAKLSGESGLTFAKKVAIVAEAFAKPVAFHDCSGPVTLAVSTHLAMACPNVVEQEITRGFYYGWYHECVDQLPRLENGFIRPPEGHGPGLSLAADIPSRPDAILRTTEA